MHLGYSVLNSDSLGTWSAYSVTRNINIFDMFTYDYYILNLKWTKSGLWGLYNSFYLGSGWSSLWLVSHHPLYRTHVIRYGVLVGEVVNSNFWVAGCLTNYKYVLLYIYIILLYYKGGFKLYHKHRKKLYSYYGLGFSRLTLPFVVYFHKFITLGLAAREGLLAQVPSMSLFDTDNKGGVQIPLVSNDSSLLVLNFHMFIITKRVMINKINALMKWKKFVRKGNLRKSLYVLWFYIYYYYTLNSYSFDYYKSSYKDGKDQERFLSFLTFIKNLLGLSSFSNRFENNYNLSYYIQNYDGINSIPNFLNVGITNTKKTGAAWNSIEIVKSGHKSFFSSWTEQNKEDKIYETDLKSKTFLKTVYL